MAGAGIHISLSELVPMIGTLDAARERVGDLSPLMDAIGQAMELTTDERFDTESGPDGKTWKPSIRARETGKKTLTMDGHLRDSVIHRADGDSVEIGTNKIYAAIHQFGGVIRAKSGHLKFSLPGGLGFRSVEQVTIPARPFLGLGGDDALTIVELAEAFMGEGLAA